MNDAKEWLKETWQKVNGSNAMKWLKILGGVALGILALTALIAGVYKIFETVGDHQAEEKDKRKHGEKKKTTSRKKKPSTKAKKMNKQKNAKSPPRGNPQRVRKKTINPAAANRGEADEKIR